MGSLCAKTVAAANKQQKEHTKVLMKNGMIKNAEANVVNENFDKGTTTGCNHKHSKKIDLFEKCKKYKAWKIMSYIKCCDKDCRKMDCRKCYDENMGEKSQEQLADVLLAGTIRPSESSSDIKISTEKINTNSGNPSKETADIETDDNSENESKETACIMVDDSMVQELKNVTEHHDRVAVTQDEPLENSENVSKDITDIMEDDSMIRELNHDIEHHNRVAVAQVEPLVDQNENRNGSEAILNNSLMSQSQTVVVGNINPTATREHVHIIIPVPNIMIKRIIGKRGWNINRIISETETTINFIKLNYSQFDNGCLIYGEASQVTRAKEIIEYFINNFEERRPYIQYSSVRREYRPRRNYHY